MSVSTEGKSDAGSSVPSVAAADGVDEGCDEGSERAGVVVTGTGGGGGDGPGSDGVTSEN